MAREPWFAVYDEAFARGARYTAPADPLQDLIDALLLDIPPRPRLVASLTGSEVTDGRS